MPLQELGGADSVRFLEVLDADDAAVFVLLRERWSVSVTEREFFVILECKLPIAADFCCEIEWQAVAYAHYYRKNSG